MVNVLIIIAVLIFLVLIRRCVSLWGESGEYPQNMASYFQQATEWGSAARLKRAQGLLQDKNTVRQHMFDVGLLLLLLLFVLIFAASEYLMLGGMLQLVLGLLASVVLIVNMVRSFKRKKQRKMLRRHAVYLIEALQRGLASGRSVHDILISAQEQGPRELRPFLRFWRAHMRGGLRASEATEIVFGHFHLLDYSFIVVFFQLYEEAGDVALPMLRDYASYLTVRSKFDLKRRQNRRSAIIMLVVSIAVGWFMLSQLVGAIDGGYLAGVQALWQYATGRVIFVSCLLVMLVSLVVIRFLYKME